MRFLFGRKTAMIAPENALPGRDSRPFTVAERHTVLDTPLEPRFLEGTETAVFGTGCFWGAERISGFEGAKGKGA